MLREMQEALEKRKRGELGSGPLNEFEQYVETLLSSIDGEDYEDLDMDAFSDLFQRQNHTSTLKLSPYDIPVAFPDPTGKEIPFPSIMHAFQACKDPDNMEMFARLELADAVKLGQRVKLNIAEWNANRAMKMKSIVLMCAKQNEDVRNTILETQGVILDDMVNDSYWGYNPVENDSNHMGRIWSEVRDELKSKVKKRKQT